MNSADREACIRHADRIIEKWQPREISEERGDVTFLGREIGRLRDDIEKLEAVREALAAYASGDESWSHVIEALEHEALARAEEEAS